MTFLCDEKKRVDSGQEFLFVTDFRPNNGQPHDCEIENLGQASQTSGATCPVPSGKCVNSKLGRLNKKSHKFFKNILILYHHVDVLCVLHVFVNFSIQNHAESLRTHANKKVLDPQRDKIEKCIRIVTCPFPPKSPLLFKYNGS